MEGAILPEPLELICPQPMFSMEEDVAAEHLESLLPLFVGEMQTLLDSLLICFD